MVLALDQNVPTDNSHYINFLHCKVPGCHLQMKLRAHPASLMLYIRFKLSVPHPSCLTAFALCCHLSCCAALGNADLEKGGGC